MNGIYDLYKNKVPASMRLYAETMLPWNKKGAIDESYFSQDFLNDLRTQVWDKYEFGEKYKPDFTRSGQIDEYGQRTASTDTLTGYPATYNTLGTYSYDIVPPMAPAFDPAMINITDKYDWEPHYGTIPDWNFTGFIGEDREGVKGKDVDLNMMREYLMNLPKQGEGGVSTLGSGLELLGNYFGPRSSEDEGIDINLKIPFDRQKYLKRKRDKEATRTGIRQVWAAQKIKAAEEKAKADAIAYEIGFSGQGAQGGGGGANIGGGQQTSRGPVGGAVTHAQAREARGGMSGWGLARGGLASL